MYKFKTINCSKILSLLVKQRYNTHSLLNKEIGTKVADFRYNYEKISLPNGPQRVRDKFKQ